MSARLWFTLRLAIIVSFFAFGFDPELTEFELPLSPLLLVIICATTPIGAVIQYAGLSDAKKAARPSHDWNASLWFSPLFKNPQSFLLTGALAITALGLASGLNHLVRSGGNPVMACLALSMGLATLAGLLAFRLRHRAPSGSQH